MQAEAGKRLAWLRDQYHRHPDPLYIDGYIRGWIGTQRPVNVDVLSEEAIVVYLIGMFDGRDDARTRVRAESRAE